MMNFATTNTRNEISILTLPNVNINDRRAESTRNMQAFDKSNPFKITSTDDRKKFFSKFTDAVKHFAFRQINDANKINRAFDKQELKIRELFNQARPGNMMAAISLVMRECNS